MYSENVQPNELNVEDDGSGKDLGDNSRFSGLDSLNLPPSRLRNRLEAAILNLEKLASSEPDVDELCKSGELGRIISDNNRELSSILQIIENNFGGLFDQLVKSLENERDRVSQLEFELGDTQTKWKSEVFDLTQEIAEKANTIAHLTSLRSLKEAREDEDILLRRLRQGESEISRLREVLALMNSDS